MIINGVNLPDLDAWDAKIMEHYENQVDLVSKTINETEIKGLKRSELIRKYCQAIFEFFNNVFGDGTDKKVFGDSANFTECINAYEEVINSVKNDDKNRANQMVTKYKGNRQQRRAQQKHNKKKQNYNKPKLVKNE